jgi:hypothetical protein
MLYNLRLFSASGRDITLLVAVRKSNVQWSLKQFTRAAENSSGEAPEFGVIYDQERYNDLAKHGYSTGSAIVGVFRRTPNRRGFSVTLAGNGVR